MAAAGAIMLWKRPRGNQPDLETVLEFVADSLVEPFTVGVVHYTITGGDTRANLDRWLSLMRKGWEACVILNRLRSCSKDTGALVAPALARGVCGPFAHLRHSEWLAAYKIKLQGGWMGVRVGGNLRWLEDCFAQSKSYKK